MPARLLIEARPRAGKTIAIGRLAELLADAGVALSGFLTSEMRLGGRRIGFEIETFAGERGLLAHVDIPGSPQVGRYGVDLEEFERLAPRPTLIPSTTDPSLKGKLVRADLLDMSNTMRYRESQASETGGREGAESR